MSALPSLAKQRRLHIIDVLQPMHNQDKRLVERVRASAQSAHRFILGDEASFQVGAWIKGCEDILLDNLQFAKPPFEKTYVELTITKVHRGMEARTTGPEATADDRLGFLIDGKRVHVIVSGRHHKSVCLGLWSYVMDTPDPVRLFEGHAMREDWLRAGLLFGTSTDAFKDEAQRAALTRGTVIRSTLTKPEFDTRRKEDGRPMGEFYVTCAAGELRTLWAVLLLINQHRGKLRQQLVPREVHITPKGRRVFAAHTLISLPLHSPKEARRFYYPDKRTSPIGHEVRGHWVRLHLRPGCVHDFPMIPDEKEHFECARCHGFRVWRKPHTRGHTEVGFNMHDYEVTP